MKNLRLICGECELFGNENSCTQTKYYYEPCKYYIERKDIEMDELLKICHNCSKFKTDKCKQNSSRPYYGACEEYAEKKEEAVNHPSHYTNGMECIDEMVAVFGEKVVACFCICNVWKYRKRAIFKNGEEDMKKADWYMKKFMELTE